MVHAEGVDAELGLFPGVHGVVTRHLGRSTYVSLTPRVGWASSDRLLINPQLSVGVDSTVDLAAFVSYAHVTGQGIDFGFDLYHSNDIVPDPDYRKNFLLVGVSLRIWR